MTLRTEFAMQSTGDWTEETLTEYQTGSYSYENATEAPLHLQRGSVMAIKLVPKILIAVAVLGALTNMLVMIGFCLAGRSKMNVSSAFIANHTTLEQLTFSWSFKTVVLETPIPVRSRQTVDISIQQRKEHLMNIISFVARCDLACSYDP